MNALQISIQRNIANVQRVRPIRKKKIFHKTNPLVKVRQFPTFGDIKKSIEPQEMESLTIKN